MKGVQCGNKLFLAEYGEYVTGMIVEVELNENGDVTVEVIESNYDLIKAGEKYIYKNNK